MPRFATLLLLLLPVAASAEITPILDLRVREEILEGVYHFAPEHDRDWIRVRTRAGATFTRGEHSFTLRLNNEHRHMLTPDQDLDFDEVILDRLCWTWTPDEHTRLTVGRQDIVWPGGFLVLEGHPLDGSRSIYHNAVRWQRDGIDAAVMVNPKYDDLVLIDDEHRALQDMDETGAYLRYQLDPWSLAILGKHETDPDDLLDDLTTITLDARREAASWHADLALQYQDGAVGGDEGSGWAWAGEGALSRRLVTGWTAEAGGFWYSGTGEHLRAFRVPWGRWPKWSEMYIYSLIGESTPGRVHVAAWEDVAAPRVQLRTALTGRLDARLTANYLFSPVHGEGRGLLTEIKLTGDLGHGLRGHLLWEWLDPGPFHDGRHGLAPLTDPVHFIRWEVSWAL